MKRENVVTGSSHCRAALILGGASVPPQALVGAPVAMQQTPQVDPSAPAFKGDPNDPKNPFKILHEEFLETAKAGGVDILFLGDSIAGGWRDQGLQIWNNRYAPRHAANFGIGGDQTQHLLWRIENGELDGIHPRIVVLMIGVNNIFANPSDQAIAGGITVIVKTILRKLPDAKILLLGILPHGEKPTDFPRARIKVINAIIAKLDDGKNVRYLNMGEKFLNPEGTVPKELLYDFAHPTEQGYQIWADAMQPLLDEMKK
jgi:lysophospholipase L1-like esterase